MKVGHWFSEATQMHGWRCPRCKWGRPYSSRHDAEITQAYHACEARPKFKEEPAMPAGESILTIAWRQLDETVDQIVALGVAGATPEAQYDLDQLKAAARGKAEILALFMVPHFVDADGNPSADAISEEAARRYTARVTGNAEYKTAGLL